MTGFDSKRQAALDKLFEVENELGLHYDQRTPMTKDEALKLALEALEKADEIEFWNKQKQAITAIKEALAQPEQESVGPEYIGIPVAYQYLYSDGSWRCSFGDPINGSKPIASRALYARKDGK